MTPQPDQSPHLSELQSLRGIAAMTVMVHHALRTVRSDGWAWAVSEIPLNARAAVVLFFVLSGYVLGLSLIRRGLTPAGVLTFYVRRGFRVYPALWAAMALATVYLWFVQPIAAPHMADWAQRHFNPDQFGAVSVLGSLAGASNYLLPTAWTITVELAASVLLPLIVFVLLRHSLVVVTMLIVLLAIGIVAGPAARQVPFYLGSFAVGAALACLPGARRVRPAWPITLLAAAILPFSQIALPAGRIDWLAMVVETFASALVIAGIVAHRVRWMRAPALVTMGDWSYSIYLLHLPIAYTVMRLLDQAGFVRGDLNLSAILVALITSALTIPLAGLVYRFVELPGIAIGAALLRRVNGRPAVPPAAAAGRV
jgi:peptidoglycan/LPS O-acetylase OafA/YrhL